jgi:hypothetical protein
MNKGESYTENELGQKIQQTEAEIISIFNKEYIPSFLIQRANRLISKWKVLTNWKEDDTPAYQETIVEQKEKGL